MQPRTKREEKMLARLEREIPARYAHQRGRRRVVMAGAGALGLLWAATVVAWLLAPSDTAMLTCFALFGLAAAIGAWAGGTLSLGTRGIIGLPAHLLDEWQSKQRLQAHARAHQLTLMLLIATYFAVIFGMRDAEESVPSAALTILFLSLMATVAALPSLVVAWRMPDPPADDEDEDEER